MFAEKFIRSRHYKLLPHRQSRSVLGIRPVKSPSRHVGTTWTHYGLPAGVPCARAGSQ
jgi:hypothetical protein